MKRLVPILLAVILVAASKAQLPTRADLVDKVDRSLVRVNFPADNPEETHVCAGFVVDSAKGWVLTSDHCVDPKGGTTVDGAPTEVVKIEEGTLAILTIPSMSKPLLTIRKKNIGFAEEVLAVGYGYGIKSMFTRHVAAPSTGLKDPDIELDGPLVGGFSGGPVVDMNGEVVGLSYRSNEYVSLLHGQDEIRDFLKRAYKGK